MTLETKGRTPAAHASLGTMLETRQGNKATCWRQGWRQGGSQDVRGWERFWSRGEAGELEKRGAVEAGSGRHGDGGGRSAPSMTLEVSMNCLPGVVRRHGEDQCRPAGCAERRAATSELSG